VGGREPVSAQRYDAAGPGSGGAASHERGPAGREKRQRERRGDGVEGKKKRRRRGSRSSERFILEPSGTKVPCPIWRS
jgi:hypothetical protein